MNMFNYQNPYMNSYAPQNNGIIWVQGIEGAKAYQMSPNSNTMLLDSENEGKFYIKTSDNVGMCNLRVFDYVESKPKTSEIDTSKFITREEFNRAIESLKPASKSKKGDNANAQQFIQPTDQYTSER